KRGPLGGLREHFPEEASHVTRIRSLLGRAVIGPGRPGARRGPQADPGRAPPGPVAVPRPALSPVARLARAESRRRGRGPLQAGGAAAPEAAGRRERAAGPVAGGSAERAAARRGPPDPGGVPGGPRAGRAGGALRALRLGGRRTDTPAR